MSALGQKQTSGHDRAMSALPPKADIGGARWDVPFVPKADIAEWRSPPVLLKLREGTGITRPVPFILD
jgi:hypothetical protein